MAGGGRTAQHIQREAPGGSSGRPAACCMLLLHPAAAFFENSIHETNLIFGPFRSFQPQAESGGCVVLSGHLAAMMAPPGRPASPSLLLRPPPPSLLLRISHIES
eukprot:COSAG01_NODE_12097_length_1801_cov_8.356639_4_plen_105_part_00